MENFLNLKKWLNKEKDNIKMFDKDSRGLYSTKDIKKGDRIMEIPEKFILELGKINDINLSKKLNNTNSYMAMYLLLESLKKRTNWKIYLDSLPKNLDEYIYFYDKDKLSELKNTSMMCKGTYNFIVHMKNIKEDCKTIYKWINKKELLKKMDYDDFFKLFLRFRIYICSRIFSYTKHNKEENGLVPYADLLNHSEDPNTTWYYDDKKEVFVVEATKDIKKKEEIYDTYGNKTNMQLIMYYGFSIKNNKLSELNFVHRNRLFTINYDSNIKELMRYSNIVNYNKDSDKFTEESIKNKIHKLLEHHTKKIKSEKINDDSIFNIYNDEINLMKNILQK